RAFARWTRWRAMWLDLEGHGRGDLPGLPDISQTVGWFTDIHPAYVLHPDDDAPDRWIADIKKQLRAIPKHRAAFGLLRYLSPDESLRARLAALPAREVVFNYLGRFADSRGASGLTAAPEQIGPLRSPAAIRPHAIEINARLVGGRLTIDWGYSTDLHRE